MLPPFDKEMTTPIAEHLRAKGVALLLGQSAEAFEKCGEGLTVKLKSGQELPAQWSSWASACGRRTAGRRRRAGSRAARRHPGQRTSADQRSRHLCGRRRHRGRDFVTGDPTQVPLAGPANRQGRIAADQSSAARVRYRGTQGTAIVGVFGLTAAMTGLTEKVLRAHRPHYDKVYVHPTHHAGYYPGAER